MLKAKSYKRLLSVILALAMLLSMSGLTAFADDPPSPPAGESVPSEAEIYVENSFRVSEKEYGESSTFSIEPAIDGAATAISGIDAETDEYSASFFVATGTGSEAAISGSNITLGAASVSGNAGHAVSVGPGASVFLDDVTIKVDGSKRYATYTIEDGVLIVKNSYLETTGAAEGDNASEPFSNAALLIYGMSRTNMSVGESTSVFINSQVIAEGWAALSTDSSRGNGLDLYAYNTYAEATNGGYATYADFGCRVHLYGSELVSSEIGAIISKSGNIEVLDTDEAVDAVLNYTDEEERVSEVTGSALIGGRNAVMIHAPDMRGEGIGATDTAHFTVKNSMLATDEEWADKAVTDYAEKYGYAIGAYVDHTMGSVILVKSTSAYITLDNAALDSYSGVLVHTVLNSDSMGNFLAEGDADKDAVDNVNVTMSDMSVSGNILHEDYQRYMYLALDNTKLEGAVVSGTYEDWAWLWNEYGDVNWTPDDSWDTVNGVHMTVANGSTWTVTETSTLSKLTIEDGSSVVAPDGKLLTLTVDGVETAIESGTYEGDIVLTPTEKITEALYLGGMTNGANTDYRTALFVNANSVIPGRSVFAALTGENADYDGDSASAITITSNNKAFNGIMVNNSDYTISNVTMNATGAGINDFKGFGAGIAIFGDSTVEIDGYNFTGVGPLRHGIYVGGTTEGASPVVTVKNAVIKVDGSVGAVASGSGMSSVPWVLGLETYGHVRAQMIAGYAKVAYENSTLVSDGWGVLSTDDVPAPANYGDWSIELTAKDSIIDFTGTSGYGAYAIGATKVTYDNSIVGGSEYSNHKWGMTYAVVVANEYASSNFVNGTNVTSKYGVMYHKTQTGLTTVEDSTFNTHGAAFLIKHCYPVIEVGNSTLNSETGVIVQLMSSDDPGLGARYYTELLDPSSVEKDENHDIYSVNTTDTRIFTTALTDVVYDAQASFSDMTIKGDFYNSVSGVDDDDLHLLGQNLVLTFDNVNLTGVISSSTAIHEAYSFYFTEETGDDGNPIAVNAEGYEIAGTWSTVTSMGQTSKVFTPETDENGEYIVVGTTKYDLYKGAIVSANATYLGSLINTPSAAVNNGVLVSLENGATWNVTGISYLTSLTIDGSSAITGANGGTVVITVNGTAMSVEEVVEAGTVAGDIVVQEVTAIRINGAALATLRKNSTLQLSIAATPSDVTVPVVWASSNPSVATVDENGLVTAVKTGTVIITVKTADGTLTSYVTIRVTA